MSVVVEITDGEADEIRRLVNDSNWCTADGLRAMVPRVLLTKLVGDADPRFRSVSCNLDGTAWRDRESLGRHLVEAHGVPEGSLITPYEGPLGSIPPGEHVVRLEAVEPDDQMITWRMRLGYAGPPDRPMFKSITTDV